MSFTVRGIDVSQANAGDLSNADSIQFIFVQASVGLDTDARWRQHRDWALAHGKILGAYHFGWNGASGKAQADHCLAVVGHSTRLVVLDIEGHTPPTPAQSREFIATCKAAGKRVGVYASLSGFPLGLGQDFNWVAVYRDPPSTDNPPHIDWTFWQWTSGGGLLDRDVFRGDLAALHAFAGSVAPVAPVAPVDAGALITRHRVVIQQATPIFDRPDGTRLGAVSKATYTATRQHVAGRWWFRIDGPPTSGNLNRWFPAEPWLIVSNA